MKKKPVVLILTSSKIGIPVPTRSTSVNKPKTSTRRVICGGSKALVLGTVLGDLTVLTRERALADTTQIVVPRHSAIPIGQVRLSSTFVPIVATTWGFSDDVILYWARSAFLAITAPVLTSFDDAGAVTVESNLEFCDVLVNETTANMAQTIRARYTGTSEVVVDVSQTDLPRPALERYLRPRMSAEAQCTILLDSIGLF